MQESKFNVDVCNRRGQTPLLMACATNNVRMIEALLDYKGPGGGAKLDGSGSPHMVTPLMRACAKGQVPSPTHRPSHEPPLFSQCSSSAY